VHSNALRARTVIRITECRRLGEDNAPKFMLVVLGLDILRQEDEVLVHRRSATARVTQVCVTSKR
jgi:hypothetical protein